MTHLTQYRDDPLSISDFWEGIKTRFPILSAIAANAIWMPVVSVEVERSFSQYKHILNDRRESLTEQNTKRLYFNGDIQVVSCNFTYCFFVQLSSLLCCLLFLHIECETEKTSKFNYTRESELKKI